MQNRSDDPSRTDFFRVVPPPFFVEGEGRWINGSWWPITTGVRRLMEAIDRDRAKRPRSPAP